MKLKWLMLFFIFFSVLCLEVSSQSFIKRTASTQAFKILSKQPQQGSMLIIKVLSDGDAYYQNKKLMQTSNQLVVFGVGRDAPKTIYLTIKQNKNEQTYPISIQQRKWKVERIGGLPPSKISPKSEKILNRIRKETALVKQARNIESQLNFFLQPFIAPAKGRISGVYGSQRILNGEPKRPHFGIDIANKQGTPVIAPASGIVTLVYDDMFYSGGTLIIDHGFGISSTFIHLHTIDVKQGQKIKQGEQVATIGSTGRSTGPHLDWRVNWYQIRLDPQLLTEL